MQAALEGVVPSRNIIVDIKGMQELKASYTSS
jgi:hypothetical protein